MAPWAIVDPVTGAAVGMTTYMNIDEPNRRLEIGSTWMGYAAQGTAINPAAKLLLLTRAFEELDCIAVEFRTHAANAQSRAAIAKLGATQDGILRNHQLWRDGTIRDTVVFSILDSEWPAAKGRLEARLIP
jgi:RimJ/RimL family protein N-acetyltransferase